MISHVVCSYKVILTYRSNLTTTIDVVPYLGRTLSRDIRVTTNQRRVAMRLDTCTATEHVANDMGSACFCIRTNLHHGISLYATDLTTAIDVTIHGAGIDADIRFIDDTFLTPEGVLSTLTCSEHITISLRAIVTHIDTSTYLTAIDRDSTYAGVLSILSAIVIAIAIFPCKRPHAISNGKCTH